MRYKNIIVLEPEQDKFIRENCKTMYVLQMAKELGMSCSRVYEYVQQNNLEQKKRTKKVVPEKEGFFNVHEMEWI